MPAYHIYLIGYRRYSQFSLNRRLFGYVLFAVAAILFCIGQSGCSTSATPTGERIVYLGWDETGKQQLFLFENGREPKQLTSIDSGISDFGPSPDGRLIAFTTYTNNGTAEIWTIRRDGSGSRRLHSCIQAECSNLTWAPDARRLIFEQREFNSEAVAGTPKLWWLDTKTGRVLPVHADENQHGTFAQLSPDGEWISYHSPQQEGLVLYNLAEGISEFVKNEIGTGAVWNPLGGQVVIPRLEMVTLHGDEGDDHETHEHEYLTAVHLLRIDLHDGTQLPLSGDLRVEDSVPAWSPDGAWIAFGRRVPGTDSARQLWLVRPDGSQARALTSDPSLNHGPPAWSADGRYLLFQQIAQNDPEAKPGIGRIDVQTGKREDLAKAAMQPAWLPAVK